MDTDSDPIVVQCPAVGSGSDLSRLRAGRALIIILVYLGIQFVTGAVVAVALVVIAVLRGSDMRDPEVVSQLTQMAIAPATVLGVAVAGSAIILLSVFWFRSQLTDVSRNGAAWNLGRAKHIAMGLLIGLLLGFAYVVIAVLFGPHDDVAVGPIAKMAVTPGAQQVSWVLLAVLLAPPIEELMFRGVVYGGFHTSFGPGWAAVVTTAVFVLLHTTEIVYFWPAAIVMTVMAIAALCMRLRARAIGPAVALHFAYNSVLAVVAVCSTL